MPAKAPSGELGIAKDATGEPRASGKAWRLSLLGDFSLFDPAGRPVTLASKKYRLLLAILALSPGKSASREALAGALWGEHSDEQAKSSLRQALAVLRKDLAGAAVNPLLLADG